MRGKFIVFDGCEGAGKSTQVKRVVEVLRLTGKQTIYTREPGGSPKAEEIRKLLLSPEGAKLTPRQQLELFFEARFDHLNATIIPHVQAGGSVICDRYSSSTRSYQIYGHERPELEELFWDMHNKCNELIAPDRYLIFDLPPEVGLKRVWRRAENMTHFDAREIEFHQRVRAGFLDFARIVPECVVINADQPQYKVEMDVMSLVLPMCA